MIQDLCSPSLARSLAFMHTLSAHGEGGRGGFYESICAVYWHRALFLYAFSSRATCTYARSDTSKKSASSSYFHSSCADVVRVSLCLQARCIIYRLVLNGKLHCLDPVSWKMNMFTLEKHYTPHPILKIYNNTTTRQLNSQVIYSEM